MSDFISLLQKLTIDNYLLAILISVILTVVFIPSINKISSAKSLFDIPYERIAHHRIIPMTGGLGIIISSLVSFFILGSRTINEELASIAGFAFLIGLLGLYDDLLLLSPLKKLIYQISIVLYIVFVLQIRIANLNGFLGLSEISYFPSILITIFLYLIIIFSLERIDAIDGLFGSFSLIICLLFGIRFAILNYEAYSILNLILVGSLASFLFFNVFSQKNRVFIGSSGTAFVGFLIAISSFKLINANSSSSFSVLGVFLYPLFDTGRVMIIRLLKGSNPFTASRDHFHNILLSFNLSHIQATIVCLIFGIAFYMVLILIPIAEIFIVPSLFLIFVFITEFLNYLISHKSTKIKMNKSIENSQIDLYELHYSLGLKDNPFSRFSAEEEIDYLDKIYYKPKYFQPLYSDISNGHTRYILGARGVGKTALLLKLKNQLDKSNVFSILIDEYEGIPLKGNAKYFLDNTIRRIVTSYCVSIVNTRYLVKKLKGSEKAKLAFFIENFFNPLTTKEFEYYLNKASKIKIKNFWIRTWNFFSKPINSILSIGIEVGGDFLKKVLGLDSFNTEMVYKDYFKTIVELKPKKSLSVGDCDYKIYKEILSDLSEIIRKSGFKQVVILYDKIDEYKEANGNIIQITEFLNEILKDTSLLLNGNFGMVFSLWNELRDPLSKKGVRFDKITPIDVTWTNSDLVHIINARLEYFSSSKKTIIRLDEILQDPVSMDEIISISNKSPRDLLRLISYIYYEQANINNRAVYLSTQAIQKGILKFITEYEYYSISPFYTQGDDIQHCIKLLITSGKISFMIDNLIQDLKIDLHSANKMVSNLLKYSIIKEIGTLGNNAESYKIIDPKVHWLINNQINPWKT